MWHECGKCLEWGTNKPAGSQMEVINSRCTTNRGRVKAQAQGKGDAIKLRKVLGSARVITGYTYIESKCAK